MTAILLIYLFISIFGIKYRKDKNDYMSKYTGTCIKGIFTLMIVLSHFKGYINISNNSIYYKFIHLFGQLMVTMFLFYSGYGIMESIKNKKDYMKNFLKNRFLKTLLHFDIAIILYVIVSLIVKSNYDISTYLLSFTGWTSIGNSNWFIFVILVLYFITYISYFLFKNNTNKFTISIITLSLLLIISLYFTKERWWYDIIICYPLGFTYSYYRSIIEEKILNKYSIVSLITLLLIFIGLYTFNKNIIIYEILSVVFCLIIVNFSYIFSVGNKVLFFIGKYSFEIYILQRIPYILFNGVIDNNVAYFVISFICVIIISVLFKCITSYIDKKIYSV